MAFAFTRRQNTTKFFTQRSHHRSTHRRQTLRVEPLEERALLSVLGSIVGYAFNDTNGNGVDDNEPRLAGVTMELDSYADETVDLVAQTDSNGVFRFEDLFPEVLYRVREVRPFDNYQTAGHPRDIWVQEGKVYGPDASFSSDPENFVQTPGLAFGNFHLAKIVGRKFHDIDGNGTWDSGEPAIPGVTLRLTGISELTGEPQDVTTTTDSEGTYYFGGVPKGTFTIQETLPSGWIETSPGGSWTGGATQTVTISSSKQLVTNVDFGNFQLGSIGGSKFNDLNGDGIWDSNESAIAGWTVRLTGTDTITSTPVDRTTTTDATGKYLFEGVAKGEYVITEVMPQGWIETKPALSPTGAECYSVAISTSGATVTGKDFGNFQLAEVRGSKFNDLNGNGTWDQGEPALVGWSIHLSGLDTFTNTVVDLTTTTDAQGRYSFLGLGKGEYVVKEVMSDGWIETSPALSPNGTAGYSVVISSSGTVVNGKDFGNFQLARVSGSKFNDLNGNGDWDDNEPALAGWVVHLRGNDTLSNTWVDKTTTTDANGRYLFSGLATGQYTVAEELVNDWIETAPGVSWNGAATYTIDVSTSGTVVTGKDFGNFQLARVSGSKFNDLNGNGDWDDNEPALAGWVVHLRGNDTLSNTWVDKTTTTDAEGHYYFGGLTKGVYTIREVVPVGWIQTSPDVSFNGEGTHTADIAASGTIVTGKTFGNHKRNIAVVAAKNSTGTHELAVVDADNGIVLSRFAPYEGRLACGVRVATGDMDGDGVDEIVTVPGAGRTAQIRVFHQDGTELTAYRTMAYDTSYLGGAQVAVADVDGDAKNDIITVPSSGSSRVKVFRNLSPNAAPIGATPYRDFVVSNNGTYAGGVVAAADMGRMVNGTFANTPDGKAEIVVGSGNGVACTVSVFDVSSTPTAVQTFKPFSTSNATYSGGMSLSTGRIDSNAIPDIVVGSGASGGSRVEAWTWNTSDATLAKLGGFSAFLGTDKYASICVATQDTRGDGSAETIYAVQGTDGTANQLRSFKVNGTTPLQIQQSGSLGNLQRPYYVAALQNCDLTSEADAKWFAEWTPTTPSSPASFAIGGPTSETFTAGQSVPIQWSTGNVPDGAKISLCYDEDAQWWNGNEHWIEIDQVSAGNGLGFYNWNTTNVKAGKYYLAGYLWSNGTPTLSHLSQPITVQKGAEPTFSLNSLHTTTYTAGQNVAIAWNAANVGAGSKISLCYDEDTLWWNGNEHWIEIDQVNAANGTASYNWNTTGVKPGTYYVAGYLWSNNSPVLSHGTQAITIEASATVPSFNLTGPTSGSYHAGESVAVQWNAANVGANGKISLCYDEDVTWWNGNERWIEIDQVSATNGAGSYQWNTSGVKPGVYYLAGYLWLDNKATFSHLTHSISVGASSLLVSASVVAETNGTVLNDQLLTPIVAEAKQRLAAVNGDTVLAALADVRTELADLPSGVLAEAAGNTIRVDRDAAGYGWFVDATPKDDREFTGTFSASTLTAKRGTAAANRVDLLTTLMHEMGHVLGCEDDTSGDLMNQSLSFGTRRAAVIDQLFASLGKRRQE